MDKDIAHLKKTLSLLSDLKSPLSSVLHNSENNFLRLGDDLQSIYSTTETITRSAVEAAHLIEGESEVNFLSRINSLAEESLRDLESFINELEGIFPRFESCIKYMKILSDTTPGIIKIAKMLNMIALNISIESSRTEEGKTMFGIFVKEISELSRRANDLSRKLTEDSEEARSNQEKNYLRIMEGKDHLNVTSGDANKIISENIKRVEEIMSLSLRSLQETEKHSQKIRGIISDVVMAIQFHDIARQQIEHVNDAIHDIEIMILDSCKMPDTGDKDSILIGKASSILNIQISQVQHVMEEISRVHGRISTGFEEINSSVTTIVKNIGRLGHGNIEEIQGESTFNILLSGFKNLEMTMAKGGELEQEIDESMKETSTSAARLSDYLKMIEDLSMQFHIKSINALIMSKRLGERGATLSVLAEYVTEGAKKSDTFVTSVVNVLKMLEESVQDLNRASSMMGKSATNQESKNKYDVDGINSISGLYSSILDYSEKTHNHSMELTKKISVIESGLSFFKAVRNDLEKCVRIMKKIRDELAPYASDDEKRMQEIDEIKQRYTMDIERKIHEKSLGDDGRVEKDINNKAQAGESDLGDNVELF